MTREPAGALLVPSPFDRQYGLELDDVSDELVRARVPVREHLLQPNGFVHGGVYASIAEGLASIGTNRGVASTGKAGLGMSNHSTFLRPVGGGTIHAVSRRRHRGATTWVWDVELTDDEDRLCAISRVTVAVRSIEPRA
ncbi:MAG: PaaI family thioesterase [Actinomycetota bacterium]|nr:PaaI family thioesterase [Actinomycetota bacterium]